MTKYKRVYADIDLDAVCFNMQAMVTNLPAGIKIAGVIKADGYGHGAVPIAKAIDEYVEFYCVATEDEALNLRLHHINKPILILGPVPGDQYYNIVAQDIRVCIFTLDQAKAISAAAVVLNKTAYIHIALDTGMSRIGMKPDEYHINLVKSISELPNTDIEGIFTHLYKGDEKDKKSAQNQIALFKNFNKLLFEHDIVPKIRHVANSAGIVDGLATDFDMVRAGITIYGIYPSDEVNKERVKIKPVMSLKSTISYIKEVEAGTEISYGGTYVADKNIKLATIPVGYGDGYPRQLSNKAYVLINGQRANVCGRICMDQFMVDITDIPDAIIGSSVTLLGKDGQQRIYVEDLSALCDRFPYEFVCDISKRVPRIYYKNGKIVGTKDYSIDFYNDFIK